jgi:hypothetical protein
MCWGVHCRGVGGIDGCNVLFGVCRHWVSKNIPLLLDKNPNVRQMAGKALAAIYSMDPHTVGTMGRRF